MQVKIKNYFEQFYNKGKNTPNQIFYNEIFINIKEYSTNEIKTIYKIDPQKVNTIGGTDYILNLVNRNYKSVHLPKINNDIKTYQINKEKIEIKYHNNKFWYKVFYPTLSINELNDKEVNCNLLPIKINQVEKMFNFAKSISKKKISKKALLKSITKQKKHKKIEDLLTDSNVSKYNILYEILYDKIFENGFFRKGNNEHENFFKTCLSYSLDYLPESNFQNFKYNNDIINENYENTDKQLFEECIRDLENDFLIIDGELWQSGYIPVISNKIIILNENFSYNKQIDKNNNLEKIITEEINGVEIIDNNLINNIYHQFNFFIKVVNSILDIDIINLNFMDELIHNVTNILSIYKHISVNIKSTYEIIFKIFDEMIEKYEIQNINSHIENIKENFENMIEFIQEYIKDYENLFILEDHIIVWKEKIKELDMILEEYKLLPIYFENQENFKF